MSYETEEYIIVPQPRKVLEMRELFSHVGDSGALCVERSSSTRFHHVIGMMIGGHQKYTSKDNELLDITFLTPRIPTLEVVERERGFEFGIRGAWA